MSKIAWLVAMLAASTTAIVAVLVTDNRPRPTQAPPVVDQTGRGGFAPAMERPNIRQLKAGYHLLERAGVPGAASAWSGEESPTALASDGTATEDETDSP